MSDSYFLPHNSGEESIRGKNSKSFLVNADVLGTHVIFFCEIKADNGQQTKRFNIIICPTAQSEFIKSLKDIVMQGQRPLQLVLIGKHAYNFHLNNVKESYSILEAGHNIKSQTKTYPQLMRNFVRCDDIDLSAVAFDFFQNTLYEGVFFDTFRVVKNYCPICSIQK